EYGEEGNIHKLVALEFGNVEHGFVEADEIFEDTFFYQGSTHLPIEQHASVAIKDPDGKLTIWSSTQTPHYLHRALAKVLEMPPACLSRLTPISRAIGCRAAARSPTTPPAGPSARTVLRSLASARTYNSTKSPRNSKSTLRTCA